MNTTKSQNRDKIALFISGAQASLQSCVRFGASSLLKGKQSPRIHSRASMRIRKTFWASCLCRAHWKNLRWGTYFETNFLLSIRLYEIQFLIFLKALHASQKQTERQTRPSNPTRKIHNREGPCNTAPRPMPALPHWFLTTTKIHFFQFPLQAGGDAAQPSKLSSNSSKSTLDAEILVNCYSLEHKL